MLLIREGGFMKKLFGAIAASMMLCAVPCTFMACGGGDDAEQKNNYNVIATVASIPPVIASLESIQNGYETYAWIERGKTYSGIELVDKFNNIGFDATKNGTTGLTSNNVATILGAVEQIFDRDENAFVNFYCVDYNAYAIYGIASKARLADDQFKITMIEDGRGGYADVQTAFIDGYETADAVYDAYVGKVQACNETLSNIKSTYGADETLYSIIDHSSAIALASNPNFEYVMQSKNSLEYILNSNEKIAGSKLYQALRLTENTSNVPQANIRFKSINEYVQGLKAEQKETYLKLMFGNERENTENMFSRTQVNGIEVPQKKLVFIGGRVSQSNKGLVDDLTSLDEFTCGYESLALQYKEVFATENDYNIILNVVNASNVSDKAKIQALNVYIEYVYTLKLTKRFYGDEYDVLFKGHPSEIVNDISYWRDSMYSYVEKAPDDTVISTEVYKQLEYDMVQKFYAEDSEGKTIGILPGGVPAENFAYISEGFALCGLPSSTYTGYEKSTIIEFVITGGKETLMNQENFAARQVEGSLVWQKGDDANFTPLMLNKGKLYLTLAEKYENTNTELANYFSNKFNAWLIENDERIDSSNVANYTVNRNGEIVEK